MSKSMRPRTATGYLHTMEVGPTDRDRRQPRLATMPVGILDGGERDPRIKPEEAPVPLSADDLLARLKAARTRRLRERHR
jgi:hypothetical protein